MNQKNVRSYEQVYSVINFYTVFNQKPMFQEYIVYLKIIAIIPSTRITSPPQNIRSLTFLQNRSKKLLATWVIFC